MTAPACPLTGRTPCDCCDCIADGPMTEPRYSSSRYVPSGITSAPAVVVQHDDPANEIG